MRWLSMYLVVVLACKHEEPKPKPEAPPPPAAQAPIRGAVGDHDLRVMLADVASAKACEMIEGQFRGTRDKDRPGVVTGVLWIRECKITNDGTRVEFRLAGNGWQWSDQKKKKAGGTFHVQQYVRFDVDVLIPGAFDMAYDRKDHVVSLWFTPSAQPKIGFKPIGDVDVDREGAWSSVVGALGSIFGSSPEDIAEKEARTQGTGQFETTLADGLAVTINLCTGLSRFNLGRPPKGEMAKPDVGETQRVPVEIQPGGVMLAGPQLANNGMTVHAETTTGAAHLELMCAKQAEEVAAGFVAGREAAASEVLGAVDVRGKATLKIKPASCPVVGVARALDGKPATISWLRPPSEIARSTGGPILHCR
jgi:hypothetical protein